MGIEVYLEAVVEAKHVDKFLDIIEELCLGTESENEHDNKNLTAAFGYISLRRVDDLVENLKIEKLPCTLYVSNSSDPSIENYTAEIKEVDGEWISDECTYSGLRVKEALKEVLNKVESGESLEQLKAYLQEQIKMTC